MTAETLLASLHLIAPELILAVGALALLMLGVFLGDKSTTTVTGLAVALLIAAGVYSLILPAEGEAFGGAFLADGFARFLKIVALVGSIATMLMAVGHARYDHLDRFEFPFCSSWPPSASC